ncbi:amino acid adenylation domain-containing protein [Desulfuromonas sp. CSMB_57]|uniref:amino acid adenylation domain-containing protein n=1 Tax=Desulfuromonas sp. CSMB_57 TaxID=2807629 RepID=UPI001CD68CA9|nr:amino acid adenylation domain-containing protein [Desulfuromonas sp. CSMB_57]
MADQLVQQYLDESLASEDKVACTDGRKSHTYGQLTHFSNRLAALLRQWGVGRQDRVLLFMRRTADFIPAILGVLKADAVYVPVDPKSPPERWSQIVDDCSPAVVLSDGPSANSLKSALPLHMPVIQIDTDGDISFTVNGIRQFQDEMGSHPEIIPTYRNVPDDLAYILYTSGSTGKPKGVMISHRNIRNYIDWAVEYFGIRSVDRILGTAPFHFDMSTFDLWCPIKAGGTLCLANEGHTMFPEKLLGYMEDQKVTIWKGISSLLFYLERAGVLNADRIPDLDRVLFGGDALPARTLTRWMEVFPSKSFFNVYGPTEATGISFCYPVQEPPDNPGDRIPIGLPCKGMQAVLLDQDQIPVPFGEIGELCLAGPGLSRGYLNEADRTADLFFRAEINGAPLQTWYRTGDLAFQRDDGHYVFVGRGDNQVKIMGYRVELGEIEQALLGIDGVRDAVVVAVNRGGLPELVGFIEETKTLDLGQALSKLRERIPGYMVPRRLLRIAEIPRCGRGKVDRAALRNMAMENSHVDG